jgi:signal transduction histidine kinase/CheY-like chemotaxis protein
MDAAGTRVSLFEQLTTYFGERVEILPSTKAVLVHLSHTIEDIVLHRRLPALLFTGFQESNHWRGETERYRKLVGVADLVCVFAGGRLLPEVAANEIRVELAGDDPLLQEWFVCLRSPQISALLCSRDRQLHSVNEGSREFATLLTFDPNLIDAVLDQLELVVQRYRPERMAELRAARHQLPATTPDPELAASLVRQLIRYQEQLQIAAQTELAERERASDTLNFLASASKLLASSLDYQATLTSIARLAVPFVGDWCAVHIHEADGSFRAVAIEHVNSPKAELLRELERRYPIQPDAPYGVALVTRTGRPELIAEIPDERLAALSLSNENLVGIRSLGWRSSVCVPLLARGRILGALTCITAESGRRYSEADVILAEDLAQRAALAIDNARLFAESQRAFQQAQQQAQELEAIFRAVPAGLAVYDISPEFCCVRHNQSFLDLVGADWRARGSIVGVPLRDLFDEQSYRATRGIFDTVVARGEAFAIAEYAAVLPPDSRPRYYTWSTTPLKDGSGATIALLVSAIEITERKAAEEQRLEIERKLLETQKLESLGLLAGGIAHDFNNLLTTVLGNVGLALMDLPPGVAARENIEQIERVAQRAADLTRQMLAYAGKGRFVIQRLDLSAIVKEMADLLQISIPKNVLLRYNFAPRLPAVEADATQIRQVVMNLVVNAADAIGTQQGVITITSGATQADRPYLSETYLAPDLPVGEYAYIEVADTGCGMDAAMRERIFEPFFTTKFTGRGLGLAAVLGIVRGHRGALKVYSEPGRGSTFKLLLPAADAAAEPLAAPAAATTDWRGAGIVLVVDDDADVRAVATRILERRGFSVLTAADGLSGLEVFREQAGGLACVLLDMTMPHMSGEEAFRAMRRLDPDTPIILMSGYNEQEVISQFAGRRLAGFLQKPFTAEDLRRLLAQIVERPAK